MHEFERVISVGEVPDPGKTLVDVEGEMVALFHVGDAWYALDDVCTHDGGPLADGDEREWVDVSEATVRPVADGTADTAVLFCWSGTGAACCPSPATTI